MHYMKIKPFSGITEDALKRLDDRLMKYGDYYFREFLNLNDIENNIFSISALEKYLNYCLEKSFDLRYLADLKNEVLRIHNIYRGTSVGREFEIYMIKLGQAGGEYGGALRQIRSVIILALSAYVIGNQETSKRSVIKLQRQLFGTSLKNDTLNNHFANPERKSVGRPKPLIIDEKKAKEATELKEKYWKLYKKNPDKI